MRIAHNLVLAIFVAGFNCGKIIDRLDLEN